MRYLSTLLITILLCLQASGQQKTDNIYNKYFTPDRLRVDLIFGGNIDSQTIYLQGLKQESSWSGSKTNLIDPFNYGEYFYQLYSGDKLIFSKGFNTLFQEWRTTAEAKIVNKAMSNCVWIPFPKAKVKLTISERVKSNGKFKEIFSYEIDPNDKSINKERENDFEIISILNSGDPSKKVDLLFVAEGYTKDEMDKFTKDCNRFAEYLFLLEPYKSRKNDFNIWGVKSISQDSGTDLPHQNIWKRTAAHSHFYTFNIDRYMTAPDHRVIANISSNAQFDAIYVIVNTKKYGGGGVYNSYGLSMADHPTTAEVFVHEFGHSFAGLGDEYYTSEVAYEDFYNLKVEPWEPNLTTLVNFDSKWKSMINSTTPQPTPNDLKYKNIVGLFEGGGYMGKGIFRPSLDCRMKNNTADGFCPVCQKAISNMIDYYTK